MTIAKFDMPEFLEGQRICLKRRTHAYDEAMWKAIDDNREFLRRYLFWVDYNRSIRDVIKATDMFDNEWATHSEQAHLIIDKNRDELLGCIGIHKFDFANHCGEVGYWLREDKTGKGYLSEALKLTEDAAFANKIRRLTIRCDAENKASANVALRNGYELESVRKEFIFTYGEFHDEEVYVKIHR